jgi:hypothetical protein
VIRFIPCNNAAMSTIGTVTGWLRRAVRRE